MSHHYVTEYTRSGGNKWGEEELFEIDTWAVWGG